MQHPENPTYYKTDVSRKDGYDYTRGRGHAWDYQEYASEDKEMWISSGQSEWSFTTVIYLAASRVYRERSMKYIADHDPNKVWFH
jgi:hypothetical protein